MFSYWAYILIGDDGTGKTKFQKYLIAELCDPKKQIYKSLPSNKESIIIRPPMSRGVKNLFTMGRSYQEKKYRSVVDFFQKKKGFKPAEICILSSHAEVPAAKHVRDMITELRYRAYNISAVFFSYKCREYAKEISLLDWDERLWLENPKLESDAEIEAQIKRLAGEFAQFLIARARLYSGSASDDIASGESG